MSDSIGYTTNINDYVIGTVFWDDKLFLAKLNFDKSFKISESGMYSSINKYLFLIDIENTIKLQNDKTKFFKNMKNKCKNIFSGLECFEVDNRDIYNILPLSI